MQELRYLELQNNRIQSVPESIGSLTKLRELWLANNGLKSLPYSLSQLTHLYSLHIENNQIGDEVVEIIVQLHGLKSLGVANTNISQKGIDWLYENLPDCEVFSH